jgi:hypothetical protein
MLAEVQPRVALPGLTVDSDSGGKPKRELEVHQKQITPQMHRCNRVLHTPYPTSAQLSEQFDPSDTKPARNWQKESSGKYDRRLHFSNTAVIGDLNSHT